MMYANNTPVHNVLNIKTQGEVEWRYLPTKNHEYFPNTPLDGTLHYIENYV